jgi:MFS family permease
LWNPLDYLRLLYWVFFFPQALRWYVDTFGDGYIPEGERKWRKGWDLLPQNSIQRQLLLQKLVLTVVKPLALSLLLLGIGVPLERVSMVFGVVFGAVFSLVFGVVSTVFGMVSTLVLTGVMFMVLGVVSTVVSVSTVVLIVVSGVVFGIASTGVSSMVSSAISIIVFDGVYGEERGVANSSLVLAVVLALVVGLVSGAANVVVLSMLLGVAIFLFRLDNWLLGLPLALRSPLNVHWKLPHVTPLPIPLLSSRLKNWLRLDWESGLHNANQILAYTLQSIPVIQAVNRVLNEIPAERIMSCVAQLTEAPCDWSLVRFASSKARLNTPARITAAGFWLLHQEQPKTAAKFFAVVRSLPYGEEMFTLAQTLANFCNAQEPVTITALQVPAFPKEPLLRPDTWKALASLRRVVEDVQVVQRSVSKSTRSFALNRALGELKTTLNNADSLPNAERELLVTIAKTWQDALLNLAGEVGEISITKPVTNPYVVGDPVEGNLFVGREDVLRQLEELWVMGHQLQSVVLYGHRRMGKTSILLNARHCSGSGVKVAYVNLLRLGDSPQGVGEVLIAITDAISDTVDCIHPSDADLLNLPYRTFERYLKQVEAHLSSGLIVALDEFEKLEELIEAEKIPKDFMGYLRGLVQMSSKVAFAFAGLHTLEEMTADYFQPFFASVIPIHVGFLQPGATRQILANPDEDFPLDYTPEALDQIYALTAGQPYLVQLVGFQLVRGYNDYVFDQGRPRDPVFTVEDVEAVINDPEFFKRGRYYFDGVWGQAARGASGQQAILKALAPHPEGLNIDALVQATGMEEKTLQEALKTLKRHDVVEESEGCWQIIVELFRRWVLQP